jgi:hypothetical protein
VAPGCKIMPLRVTGQGGGTISDLSDAIRYAAGLDPTATGPKLAAPLRIINVSLGTSQPSAELQAACEAAEAEGTLICAASGNSGGAVLYPAAYPSVLAVGAVDGRLVYASYSNKGPSLDCVAPGGNENRDVAGDGFSDAVLSTVLDETQVPAVPGETAYSGTSMAVPHVAGVAALVLSVDPSLSLAALRTTLLSTCRDLDVAGIDDVTGHGLVQAGAAVRFALAAKGTPRADAPRLLLSTGSIRLPSTESVGTIHVDNGGGGVLHVAGVTVSTDSGTPWLSSFLPVGPHSDAVDAGMIAVAVNRTGLPVGTYAGNVYVSDGAATIGSIRVVMEVGPVPLTAATILVVVRQQPRAWCARLPWPTAPGLHAFGLAAGTYYGHRRHRPHATASSAGRHWCGSSGHAGDADLAGRDAHGAKRHDQVAALARLRKSARCIPRAPAGPGCSSPCSACARARCSRDSPPIPGASDRRSLRLPDAPARRPRDQAVLPRRLGPVPPGARLTFEIEGGTTHQVGDELAAAFVIHNDGTEAFRAVYDGSGSRRGHEHLEATDETGRAVLDPVTSGFSGNGPMGPGPVAPGASLHVKGIPQLGRYLRFDRPGTFRIRASIDLGWTDTPERSNPVAEVTLVLTRPTPEDAAAAVARRIAKKRADEAQAPGRWVWPCLEDLYDPAYVPALVEALAQGELDAVEGLRSIDDPSAIDALSAATQSRDGAIVRAAARALSSTVPAVATEADAAAHRQLPSRAALSCLPAARVRERIAALLSETGDA